MGIIGFLGFVCILWGLYTLVQSIQESTSQQREILEELKQLRVLGESLKQKQAAAEPPVSAKLDGLININQADIETLQSLPGVGKVLAQKIIDKRPYGSVEALLEVQGISQEFLSKLQPLVKV